MTIIVMYAFQGLQYSSLEYYDTCIHVGHAKHVVDLGELCHVIFEMLDHPVF